MGFIINPSRFTVAGWDFEDDFTDSQVTLDARWGQAGTLCKPVATQDDFDWDGERTATNQAMATQPVGAAVSDTAWVLQFKLTNDVLTPGTYSSFFGFGMRSVSQATGAVSGTPDSIMGSISIRSAESNKWHFEGDDGVPWASPQMGANEFSGNPGVASYWYRMIRLTSTTATKKIYSDAYISLIEQKAGVTIASTIVDTDYITFQNDNNGDVTSTFNGRGDDVKFANAVTVAP